jgi:ferredoxin
VPKVHFINEVLTVDAPEGTTLRDVAQKQGIELCRGLWPQITCQGNGICGRCRVWVLSPESHTSKRTLRERLHQAKGQLRLACRVVLKGDVAIRTMPVGDTIHVHSDLAQSIAPASYQREAEQRYQSALTAERLDAEKKAAEAAAKEKTDPLPATPEPEAASKPGLTPSS